MKIGITIIIIGVVMILLGMIAFYSIQGTPDSDILLRSIKYGGTFFGIMGIGVSIAGGLLYLFSRSLVENYES